MYDVMRLDINIFPLIRQTPSPPPRARTQFLNGKTITLDSRARACGTSSWKSSSLSRPSFGLCCTAEKATERSSRSRSTNREDRAVPRTHHVASRRIASRRSSASSDRFIPAGQSFRRGSHKGAFTERYANASAISHTAKGDPNVDNAGRMRHPRDFCVASPRRSRDSWDGAPRRKPMRIRDPMFITASRTPSAIGNCKFCRGTGTQRSLCGTSIPDGCNNNKSVHNTKYRENPCRVAPKRGDFRFKKRNLPAKFQTVYREKEKKLWLNLWHRQ